MDQNRYNDNTLNDFQRYILHIYKTKRWDIKLTKLQHQILWIFCEKEIAHAYECRNYLISKYNKEIAPKNVRKYILKLAEIGLIKRKMMEERTKHNAVYYTLSSFGIFYIINNSNLIAHDLDPFLNIKSLFVNHPYDNIFKYFLYPIINQRLIKKIDNEEILRELIIFLRNCSNSIKKILRDLLKIEKNGGYSYIVTIFPYILDSSVTEISPGTLPYFILFLQKRLNINGLDINKSKIEEIKKSEILKITSNEKVLFLKLEEKKNKAILYQENNGSKEIIFNFDLEKDLEVYFISEFVTSTTEEKIISYQPIIEREFHEKHLPALGLGLLQANYSVHNSQSFKKEDEQSYTLLANNPEFMTLLEKIRNDFDLKYHLFKSMNKNISLK